MTTRMGAMDWDERDRPVAEPARGARVLVADDDVALRELIAMSLSDEGYQVYEAVSGPDLIHTLEQIGFDDWPLDGVDLVILDLRMPGMSGLETIRQLRAAHWSVPALLVTAFPDAQVKRQAEALGVGVLAKPFTLDELAIATLHELKREHAPT